MFSMIIDKRGTQGNCPGKYKVREHMSLRHSVKTHEIFIAISFITKFTSYFPYLSNLAISII
jgi:hypothetical protein